MGWTKPLRDGLHVRDRRRRGPRAETAMTSGRESVTGTSRTVCLSLWGTVMSRYDDRWKTVTTGRWWQRQRRRKLCVTDTELADEAGGSVEAIGAGALPMCQAIHRFSSFEEGVNPNSGHLPHVTIRDR
jgi:hypothetical protein